MISLLSELNMRIFNSDNRLIIFIMGIVVVDIDYVDISAIIPIRAVYRDGSR